MLTAPGSTQPPCPCCKERDRANEAEAKIVELTGVIDTLQSKLDKANCECQT